MPRKTDLLMASGLKSLQSGEYQKAQDDFHILLKHDPKNAQAHHYLGVAYLQSGEIHQAAQCIRKSLDFSPSQSVVLSNYGYCLYLMGGFSESVRQSSKAVNLDPVDAAAWTNLANAQYGAGDYISSEHSYRRALRISPANPRYSYNLGTFLYKRSRFREAADCFTLSLERGQNAPEVFNNLASCFLQMAQPKLALENATRAANLNEAFFEAWINQGTALSDLGLYDLAYQKYLKAIELKPTNSDARYNLGILELRLKRFDSGFENYRHRWKSGAFSQDAPSGYELKAFEPDLTDPLLLWAEQGLGDEIFYLRLLPSYIDRASPSQVTVAIDKRLHALVLRSFKNLNVVDRTISDSELSRFGYPRSAPLADLGWLLSISNQASLKRALRPLIPDTSRRAEFLRMPPFSSGKPVCGLSWASSSPGFKHEKTVPLETLTTVLTNNHFNFVSLQYGDVKEEIESFEKKNHLKIYQMEGLDLQNDIDELVSIIDICDCVLSVSNVIAHLAGAVGKPGCVMVPKSKGLLWYWHVDDYQSIWYPSLKIARATDHDWMPAVNAAAVWLSERGRF